MATLYTIELTHTDGRPSLWAAPRPSAWLPEFGGQATAYHDLSGLFDHQGVKDWLAASSLLGAGFRAHVRVANGRGAVA